MLALPVESYAERRAKWKTEAVRRHASLGLFKSWALRVTGRLYIRTEVIRDGGAPQKEKLYLFVCKECGKPDIDFWHSHIMGHDYLDCSHCNQTAAPAPQPN